VNATLHIRKRKQTNKKNTSLNQKKLILRKKPYINFKVQDIRREHRVETKKENANVAIRMSIPGMEWKT